MANYCQFCGKEIPSNARFCNACGNPVTNAAPTVGQTFAQATPAQKPPAKCGFFDAVKAVVLDYLKHPVKLLPTIILTVIWILFSLVGTLGSSNPVIRLLNTLTYSNGGMYGGLLGTVGGMFGKAFFAAIVTSLVNTLINKKSKTKIPNSKGGLKGASVSALASVAPFLIGAGSGLILYCFFNITSTPKNIMVAVAGAAAAVVSVVSGHGFLFSIISWIAGKLSNGKTPSISILRHALGGFTAGFAVAIPVTFARKPFLIAVLGAVLLLAGILFAVIGKDSAKRAVAGAAVMLLAGSMMIPFVTVASAGLKDEASALTGKYSGTVQMTAGSMTDVGYSNYTAGKLGLNDFVKAHMGGGSSTLSRTDLDKKLTSLIQSSQIQAAKNELHVETTDAAKGKCTVSFSLSAQNCNWKAKEDAFVLGADAINVTLNGTYKDKQIAVTSGSGDITAASGTILVSAAGGKIVLDSSGLMITVANGQKPIYDGQIELSVETASKSAGLFKKEVDINAPITIDDIVGVYLYTGMNYATETIEDAYFKIEKLSGDTFRFTAFEVENYGNQDAISIYNYDQGKATGSIYNTVDKWYRTIAFTRTEGGGMQAIYELHLDLGAGYGTLDHWVMHRVDTWPGKPEETTAVTKPETVPATEAPEPEETEPFEEEPDVTEPEEPEDVTPNPDYEGDHYENTEPYVDPDHEDLPDTVGGTVAEAVGTAILGGGAGLLLGGLAGGTGGGDGNPNGDGDGGGVPSGWMFGNDGTISWIDPASGKTVTYEQTGFDPDTGQPEYHNAEDWGQGYNVDDLKEMYDRVSGEKDYYKAINDTYEKTQDEQRKDNEGLSWEAKDWEREKKDMAEQERRDEIRNKIAYSHGVYDGNVKEVKKDILQKTNEEYKEQAKHETRAEYMNAGYQTSQTVQKGADVAINAMEKVASLTPATAPIGKAIKKAYIVGKNVSSNVGHLTAGTKTLGQATMDAAIGSTADLVKDSADGFGQKMLYNTTMEGGKTVFQGWVDGKSAEEIRDETIKNIKKEANNTINEGLNQAVFGDTPLTQIITDLDNMDKNED